MTEQLAANPNAAVIAENFRTYLSNANQLDLNWRRFFDDLDEEARALVEELHRAKGAGVDGGNGAAAVATALVGDRDLTASDVRAATLDSIRALMLIRAYRVRGHLEANLDPLGLKKLDPHPELDPKTYGFTEADLDRPIFINNVLGMETATLRQILSAVRETYCGTIGVEFMHIQDPDQKKWIQERIESIHNRTDFTVNGKRAIFERLCAAEVFERFLDKKYNRHQALRPRGR